jgi:hypothetical protein
MGTYYTNGTKNLTWKEFVYQEIDTPKNRIIQCSIKGRVAYLACEVAATGAVYGLVLLLTQYNGDKGYKPVEESMGPFETQAPISLINRLTPTNSDYANQWRELCRRNAAKRKVKVGDKIKLPAPISWNFGGSRYESDVFEVVKFPHVRGMICRCPKGGLVKLSRIDQREKEFLN